MNALKPIQLYWSSIDKKAFFCLIFLCSIAGSAFQALQIVYLGDLLNIMAKTSFSIEEMWLPLLLVLAVNVCAHIFYRGVNFFEYLSIPNTLSNIREKLSTSTINRTSDMFANELAGSISHRINQIPLSYRDFVHSVQWVICGQFTIMAITLFVTFKASLTVGSLVLCWMLFNFFVAYLIVSKYIRPVVTRLSKRRSIFSGYITDMISNIQTVVTNNWKKNEKEKLDKILQSEARTFTDSRRITNYFYIFMATMELIFLSASVYISAFLVQSGDLSIGTFVVVTVLIFEVSSSIWEVSQEIPAMMESSSFIDEGLSFLNSYDLMSDNSDNRLQLESAPSLHLDGVNFRYKDGGSLIFNKLDIHIKPGEKVALVGHSGAGKTSLVNLLLGFYEPESGHVKINGNSIKSYSQDSYREHISVIPQDTSLFHLSVHDNICYGQPEASYADVVNASRKAHADEFISNLSEGYNSMVGDRGVQLSGGQRQRIAIARAILKNSPILILDEATSALDSVSESYIQESLVNIMQDKTVIAIAHRLSTIIHMDRIIVLDNGTVLEEGSHEELLKNGKYYAEIWSKQSGGFLQD